MASYHVALERSETALEINSADAYENHVKMFTDHRPSGVNSFSKQQAFALALSNGRNCIPKKTKLNSMV
jgi:hypothetical protein